MSARLPQSGRRRRRFSALAVLLFVALLLFPAMACLRLTRYFDSCFVFGYLAAISIYTIWLYWHDKRRAEADGWRTPESTLHFAELLGGWPAAFLAQRAFRHKISKTSYQAGYWTIVAFHELLSFDFLHDWLFLRRILLLLHQ